MKAVRLTQTVLVLCLLTACTKSADTSSFRANRAAALAQGPVDFTDSVTWDAHYDASVKRLMVDVHLKKGFHAYAPGEKVGKPVTLNILPLGKWKLTGPIQVPAGMTKRLGQQESNVLEDNFTLSVPMEGGKKVIYGELVIQVCTETQCDKPRLHPFMVKVKKPETPAPQHPNRNKK